MERGKTRGVRDLRALLLRVVLVASLLFFAYPSSLHARSSSASQQEIGESNSAGGVAGVDGNLALYRGSTGKGPVYLLADVAVDEDFLHQLGDGSEAAVRKMVEDVNTVLDGVGLYIVIASIQHWHSDDTARPIVARLDSAEQQTQHVAGRLFLAITGADTVRFDGWAQESKDRMIVQYHEDEEQNALLVSHEIGHLMGAGHHEDGEGCTEEVCIMGRSGYSGTGTWCQHHQQVIREHIASSLGLQDLLAGEQMRSIEAGAFAVR